MRNLRLFVLLGMALAATWALAQQSATPAMQGPQMQGVQPQPAPAAPATATATQEQQEILNLTAQLQRAGEQNDAAFFERVLAPDYTAVNAWNERENRDTIIKAHRKSQVKYESINVVQGPYVQVNGDTATEVNVANVKGTYEGARFDGVYHSVRTWQKRNGQWQMVSMKVTKIQ